MFSKVPANSNSSKVASKIAVSSKIRTVKTRTVRTSSSKARPKTVSKVSKVNNPTSNRDNNLTTRNRMVTTTTMATASPMTSTPTTTTTASPMTSTVHQRTMTTMASMMRKTMMMMATA